MFKDLIKLLKMDRVPTDPLKALAKEIAANLEILQVTQQQDFVSRCFLVSSWQALSSKLVDDLPADVLTYAQAIEAFNRDYFLWKECEAKYSSDDARKTRENALELNQLSENLEEHVKTLENKIRAAQAAVTHLAKERTHA